MALIQSPGVKPKPRTVAAPGMATAAAGGTGVVDPNWRPPTAPPPTAPPTTPIAPPTAPPMTPIAPPAAPPQAPGPDPRKQDLLDALNDGSNIKPLDLSDITRRGAGLRDLLAQLMRGEGIAIGDQSNDPAARAYAIQKQRQAERLRESEAARFGASGGADVGGFEGRAAQIMTDTGEAIAQNVAELTNKRKGEALQTAITGANLQMSDLDRDTRARQAEYGSRLDAERLNREGKQTLLQALMADEAAKRGDYQRDIDRQRDDRRYETDFQRRQAEQRFQEQREAEMRQIAEERARIELERARREEALAKKPVSRAPYRGGVVLGGRY